MKRLMTMILALSFVGVTMAAQPKPNCTNQCRRKKSACLAKAKKDQKAIAACQAQAGECMNGCGPRG